MVQIQGKLQEKKEILKYLIVYVLHHVVVGTKTKPGELYLPHISPNDRKDLMIAKGTCDFIRQRLGRKFGNYRSRWHSKHDWSIKLMHQSSGRTSQ